jgi:nitroreductase
MNNETLETIRNRRTTRKFKSDQITQEELDVILEAGIYAPSAHNEQAWNFTVVQNKELLQELNEVTKEIAKGSQDETIRKMANNKKLNIFYNAPTIIIVSGKKDGLLPKIDCAAATQNMLLAAESIDVGGCWNGLVGLLFYTDKGNEYKKKLNIPEGYEPYHAVVLGYKDTKIKKALPRKENTIQYVK